MREGYGLSSTFSHDEFDGLPVVDVEGPDGMSGQVRGDDLDEVFRLLQTTMPGYVQGAQERVLFRRAGL